MQKVGKKKPMVKQSRKKPAKTCLFCRLRKLKCDRVRPVCGSCSSRNLGKCDYEENITLKENQLRSKYRKYSKFDMARRIEELESRVSKQVEADFHLEQNPLRNVRYLFSKHNRHILHGPTSFRAILARHTNTFAKYREIIWKVLKGPRNDWKQEHQHSTLSEISSIENASSHTNSKSVIQSLCNSLPTYEAFQQYLIGFFNSNFYKSYQIVNEQKIFKDLNDCFVKGPKNLKTGCHKIVGLNLGAKKNYYKVGVMTVIMALGSHPNEIPESVQIFHKFLTSFISAKVFYIERVEFLFLRYLYINMAGIDGGDQSNCVFLHGLTVDTVIHIGLNEDLRHLFVNENHPILEIPYLERLWLWIIFTDIKISLSTGIPLRICDIFVSGINEGNYSSSKDVVLYKTTIKLRSIMKEIYALKTSPNIPLIIEDLKAFTTKYFKPLNFYLNPSNLDGTEFIELQLWHITLHMLASLSNLHIVVYHDYSPVIFNTSILAPLNSLHLCFRVLEGYFDLDNRRRSSDSRCLSKTWLHINNALLLVHMEAARALIQIYTLFLQFMENKDLQASLKKRTGSKNQSISAGDIEGPRNNCLSLSTVFKRMEEIFEEIYHDKFKSLRDIWHNSYNFFITISMEKIGREAFGKAIHQMDEGPTIEEKVTTDNSTTILNNLEDFLMNFSGNFAEDDVGTSDDIFNTAVHDWDDFFP